jgi:hypothetical protein
MSNLGEVEITLDEKRHVLQCSLRAARTISALSGGFVGAFEGISRFQMATYVQILAAGLDKRSSGEIEALEEAVYRNGLETLSAPLSKYLNRLMNGGRDPSSNAEGSSGNG